MSEHSARKGLTKENRCALYHFLDYCFPTSDNNEVKHVSFVKDNYEKVDFEIWFINGVVFVYQVKDYKNLPSGIFFDILDEFMQINNEDEDYKNSRFYVVFLTDEQPQWLFLFEKFLQSYQSSPNMTIGDIDDYFKHKAQNSVKNELKKYSSLFKKLYLDIEKRTLTWIDDRCIDALFRGTKDSENVNRKKLKQTYSQILKEVDDRIIEKKEYIFSKTELRPIIDKIIKEEDIQQEILSEVKSVSKRLKKMETPSSSTMTEGTTI